MGTYKNVMEILVEQEVARQVEALPSRVASYINQTELLAFALNQLPSLYATSQKGLEHQLEKGRIKFGSQVRESVQRAIAAVRRDPLRSHVPLQESAVPSHPEVLSQVRRLLKNDQIEWETLPSAIEQILLDKRRSSARSVQSSPLVQKSSPFAASISSQFTSGSSPSVQPGQPSTTASISPIAHPALRDEARDRELFGWDDPLYDPRFPK